MRLKRVLALTLVLCLFCGCAGAEGGDIFGSIGSWFSQAWEDTSKWVSQAWQDTSKWAEQAWKDVSAWTEQAWKDSSEWVSQAWKDSSEWVSVNWNSFIAWVNSITAENPYGWIQNVVTKNGTAAYDEFAALRAFLAENPDAEQVRAKVYAYMTELQIREEDRDTLWNMLDKWAGEKGLLTEQVGKLALPFVVRLKIEGGNAIGTAVTISGPIAGQYVMTIMESQNPGSKEQADARLNMLKSALEALKKPE